MPLPGRMPPEPSILARHDDLWALCKPAGWAVHQTGDGHPTLTGWLEEAGAPSGMAPVHRLDLDTSGVVLFAWDPGVRAQLGEGFAAHQVQKVYSALVYGRIHQKGIIRRPLQDARRKRVVDAVTRYRLLEVLGRFSLIRVCPETGRKHQIRRHLQGIGHGICGDRRYRAKQNWKLTVPVERLWLHAESLTLPDGREFQQPLLDDLQTHLEALRQAEKSI